MIINFPSYSHWSRTSDHYIKNKLVDLGCTIIKETGDKIEAKVPEEWYLIQKNDFHLEVYTDRNYTKKVAVIKENMNTGRMLTLFED
jgi:hypothetical protein